MNHIDNNKINKKTQKEIAESLQLIKQKVQIKLIATFNHAAVNLQNPKIEDELGKICNKTYQETSDFCEIVGIDKAAIEAILKEKFLP